MILMMMMLLLLLLLMMMMMMMMMRTEKASTPSARQKSPEFKKHVAVQAAVDGGLGPASR
jgi:preprotein translocase subunit YajC